MEIRLFDTPIKEGGCLVADRVFFDNKAGMVLMGDKCERSIWIFRTINGQNISHFIDRCLNASVCAKLEDSLTNNPFSIRGRWILEKSVDDRDDLRFHTGLIRNLCGVLNWPALRYTIITFLVPINNELNGQFWIVPACFLKSGQQSGQIPGSVRKRRAVWIV